MKAIKLVLKDIEWSDQLSMKRKGNCKSAYLWRKARHILYIQWDTNLSKRGDGSYFTIFNKATLLHHQEDKKKMNIKFVMRRVKIYLGSSYFPFTREWLCGEVFLRLFLAYFMFALDVSLVSRVLLWSVCRSRLIRISINRFSNFITFLVAF